MQVSTKTLPLPRISSGLAQLWYFAIALQRPIWHGNAPPAMRDQKAQTRKIPEQIFRHHELHEARNVGDQILDGRMREVLVDRFAAVQHERHIQPLRRFENRIIVLSGEGLVLPAAAGAIGIEIERDETLLGPTLDLFRHLLGWRRRMLSEHAHRRKAAGIQLTGAKDKPVIEIGPDGVLFRSTFMCRHGFRTRRSERDIDATRIHQADTCSRLFLTSASEMLGTASGFFPESCAWRKPSTSG